MIDQSVHNTLNVTESCDYYLNELNYTELNVSAPLGTRVFLSPNKDRVVRIGHDEGYHIFSSSVMSGVLVLNNVVEIYDHRIFNRSGDVFYTITEMEKLDELNYEDVLAIESWNSQVVKKLDQPKGLIDPYSLLNDFVVLFNFINGNDIRGLTHDYLQSKNIMKRGTQFVIIDPIA